MTTLAERLTAPQLPHKHQECQKKKRITLLAKRCLLITGVPGNEELQTVGFPRGVGSRRPESEGRGSDVHPRENTQNPDSEASERRRADSKVIKGQSGAVMDVLCFGV